MTINKDRRLIRWDVPPETRGKQNITVSVNDGNGGEAVQSFILEITPEQKKSLNKYFQRFLKAKPVYNYLFL